jgi:hypothetical protein
VRWIKQSVTSTMKYELRREQQVVVRIVRHAVMVNGDDVDDDDEDYCDDGDVDDYDGSDVDDDDGETDDDDDNDDSDSCNDVDE